MPAVCFHADLLLSCLSGDLPLLTPTPFQLGAEVCWQPHAGAFLGMAQAGSTHRGSSGDSANEGHLIRYLGESFQLMSFPLHPRQRPGAFSGSAERSQLMTAPSLSAVAQ